jgi:radical SAM protein with 4Fe4S-binding SPASM domain
MLREVGYMNFDLFKKIIKNMYASSIHFSGLGEPLLHPQIREMFTYAKEEGFEVGLWTNGLNLSEDFSKEIVEKELVDYIIFGLDAATQETYAKVRGVDVYDKVVENITRFLELKKEKAAKMEKDSLGWWERVKPIVGVQILKMKETDLEIEEFMNKWDWMDKVKKMINYRNRSQEVSKLENEGEKQQASRKLSEELWKTFYTKAKLPVEHAIIGHFDRYCNQIEDKSVIDVTPLKRFTCRQLSSSPTILWNGDAVVCRHDINGEYILGNLRKQDMKDITKKIEDLWQAHRDGKYDNLPLCGNCKEWYYDLYA